MSAISVSLVSDATDYHKQYLWNQGDQTKTESRKIQKI